MVISPSSEVGIISLGHCHANTDLLLVGTELMCIQGYLLNHTYSFQVHCTSLKLTCDFAWYIHNIVT